MHLGRYKQPCVSHPEHVIVSYLKASELVKVATRVAMCCFGMLLMALDQIFFPLSCPLIFLSEMEKKKGTHYVDHKRGIRIVSGAVIGRTFLFKLISPHFQVEFILSETMVFYRL